MDTITLPQNLFAVQDLATLSGLVVAVYVIVSFLKDPLKAFAKWLTGKDDGDWIVRPATVLVALAILIWLMFIQGAVTAESIGLAVINAFLVALIAGAAHDYIVAPTKSKVGTVPAANTPTDIIKPQMPDVSPPVTMPETGEPKDEPPISR